MKLTENQILFLEKIVNLYNERYTELRLGQTWYIVVHKLYPDIIKDIVGTDRDPFYKDSNIPKFLEKISE